MNGYLASSLKGRKKMLIWRNNLELLRIFLESADFGQLRSRCEELLLVGKLVSVRLKSINALPKYEVEVIET
jgi:hypothetical protein